MQSNPLESELMESMKRSMSDELEQRRSVWEKDVQRMQDEFYGGKLDTKATTPPVQRLRPAISGTPGHATQGHPSSDCFRCSFDVRDYGPEEINVRAEGRILKISAQRAEGGGSARGVTRQFNRQVNIPENADVEKLISYLNADGSLTVEAPLRGINPTPPPAIKSSNQQLSPVGYHGVLSGAGYPILTVNPYQKRPNETSRSPAVISPSITSEHIRNTEFGRILILHVDLGCRDYKPNQVKVKIFRDKVSVSAQREELRQGRTSRREFQREFDLPEPVKVETMSAVLDVNSGVVFIGASLMSNVEHGKVERLIMLQQPAMGRQVVIERQY